jgi:hypothetical protein
MSQYSTQTRDLTYHILDSENKIRSHTKTQNNRRILSFVYFDIYILKKDNSVVLSPLANYNDRAIAAGQRS